MKQVYKLLFFFIFTGLLFLAFPENSDAQCAMCKAVTESNRQQSGEPTFGANLNNAILYLMAVPYLVLTFLAFLFFKKQIMARLGKIFNF